MLDERGSKENLRAGFPTDRKPCASHYDYADDSDLEEDDDDDILDDEAAGAPQAVMEKSGNNPVAVVLENLDTKGNESPDIVSVSDLDSFSFESSDTKDETGITSFAHVGEVVVIEDVALITLVCFPPFPSIH